MMRSEDDQHERVQHERYKAGRQVDVFELARVGRDLRGHARLVDFARLLEGLPAQPDRMVEWELAGVTDSLGRAYLTLRADAVVTLECQRCLGLFELPLHVESRLQLVRTEAELEAEDAGVEDPDAPDVILGSTHFDALSLIEDELILGLPYVPKHEVCPSLPKPLEADEGDDTDTDRPSPFAALAELKKH